MDQATQVPRDNAGNQAQGWSTSGQPQPAPPKFPHDNPDAVDHALIGAADKQEGGKEMGLPHAPIIALHPSSAQPQDQTGNKKEFRIIEKANVKLNHFIHEAGHHDFAYPFGDLEERQGMFIPVEKGSTTDKLINQIYSQVDQFRKQNSEVERDENGDDVMEDVAINVKKRNEDGTVQLDGGEPRMDIKSGFRPKLIGPAFSVKAVVKGDKLTRSDDGEEADSDGVLVIRLN